jgi:hypothetical protein
MIQQVASDFSTSNSGLTLWGIKAIKILQLWKAVNEAYVHNDENYQTKFHQLLHQISNFSSDLQHANLQIAEHKYNSQLSDLIDLLLDATFEKFDIIKLNAFIKNHWKGYALSAAREIKPYFYFYQLEENRRVSPRRSEQGCRRRDAYSRDDDRRHLDRRKFLAI